jgi:RNA ligase (TIGR02306 family)
MEETKRKLVTIQRIKKLEQIEGADRIEKATVLGWNLVVIKGEFKEGDLCVYFEIDSLLPMIPAFEFMAKNGTKKMTVEGKEYEGYRLKTVRLKGQISQGLALPIGSFADKLKIQDVWEEGKEVTQLLGVIKYEPPIPASLSGKVRGFRPEYMPKTDEPRIQIEPEILEKYKDTKFYVTEKIDGSSVSIFVRDGEFHVCSRNLDLLEDNNNTIWRVAREMKLEEKLKEVTGRGMALQGEIVGEGIQENPLKLKGQTIYFFNAYDFNINKYLDFSEFKAILEKFDVKMVPLLYDDIYLPKTIDEAVKFATRKSAINTEGYAEGVVFRSMVEMRDEDIGRLSFKVINPEYLLEHKE